MHLSSQSRQVQPACGCIISALPPAFTKGRQSTRLAHVAISCVRAQVWVLQDVLDADALILGAPGRQGGMCGEMRMFLDSLAELQSARGLQVSPLGASGRFCLWISNRIFSSYVGCHFLSNPAGQSWRCIHQRGWEAARLRGS